MNSEEILLKLEESQGSHEFLSSMQAISLVPNRQL